MPIVIHNEDRKKGKSRNKSKRPAPEKVKKWKEHRTKAEMNEKMYMRIRNVCGLLGVILPWLAFFFLLAYNSIYLFTRSGGYMTERKKLRNKIYKYCGWSMIGLEVLFVILAITPVPGYCTMITEIFLLFLFGMSWLVKGDFFPCFRDEE